MKYIMLICVLVTCVCLPIFADSSIVIQLNDIACTNSTVWVGTSEGLFTIRTTDGVVSYASPVPNEVIGINCIEQAPDGSLWMNGKAGEVMWYSDGQWSVLTGNDIGAPQDGFCSFSGFTGMAFYETPPEQSLAYESWFASGFDVFHYDGTSTTPYYNFEWHIHSSFPIFDLVIDNDGTAWSIGSVGLVHYLSDGTILEDQRYRGYAGRNLILDENGVFWIASYEDGLVRIEGDSVHTFTPDNSDIPSNEVIDIAFDVDGVLWVLTGRPYGNTTSVSSFDGESWTVHDGSDIEWLENGASSLAIDQDGTKWIGTTFDGVVSFDGSDWTHYDLSDALPITAVTESAPVTFELLPSYPNPFNASTTIPFKLTEPGHAKLSVHSSTGQRVATLIDRQMSAGTHHVVFNGKTLPSGLYFSRLETDGLVRTGRMMLVK